MSKETIMLAKTYTNESQLKFPVYVSEKLDGVAGHFYMDENRKVHAITRQNEPIKSVQHISDYLEAYLVPGEHVIGELYIQGKAFKDISGFVRRDEQCEELRLYVYDYFKEGFEDAEYFYRIEKAYQLFDVVSYIQDNTTLPVGVIPMEYIYTIDGFNRHVDDFEANNKTAEGLVIRSAMHKAEWKAGWRSPGMLKMKRNATADLKVVSVEQALDADGNPKGMVGRINVMYGDKVIGVGPGKLTHKERIEIFENQDEYIGKIVEVKYMPDESYDALREPRFYRWREDKTEPNKPEEL